MEDDNSRAALLSDGVDEDNLIVRVPERPRTWPRAAPPRRPPRPESSEPSSPTTVPLRLPGQKRSLTPRQAAAGSFLDPSAFEYLGCDNSDMDWCALPGAVPADCPSGFGMDDDVDDVDEPDGPDPTGGGGSGTSPPTPTTTQDAPEPTYTWRVGIFSEKDCSGDYYSLEGHNEISAGAPCVELRGSAVGQQGDPSCGWYTNSGGTHADCSAATLKSPQSWQLLSYDQDNYLATCDVYDNAQCTATLPLGGTNPWYYDSRGCQNFNSSRDPTNWGSIRCGVLVKFYT